VQTQSTILTGDSGLGRYHLMLARSSDIGPFEELVAASGVVRTAGNWMATVESGLVVSSVEADARLARWSRRTGGLAIRISRPDPSRFWLAVHLAGERLLIMVHMHGTEPGGVPPTVREFGRDPLMATTASPDPAEIWRRVGRTRAEQLQAALQQGGVEVELEALATLFCAPPSDGETDRVRGLLDILEASGVQAMVGRGTEVEVSELSGVVGSFVGRALLSGCLIPMAVGTAVFLGVSRLAVAMNLGPIGFLAAVGAAWASMSVSREFATRLTAVRGRAGAALSWAEAPVSGGAPRLTPEAQDTWGGLFYILRDIAFFAGIERPAGPAALYIEAWGFGPSGLVRTVNRVADGAPNEALFDAAQSLVRLRSTLIDRHLAGEEIVASDTRSQVQALLAPALTS